MADWAKLKVVDLKAELKRRDLPQHGLKAELVARLDESDADTVPAEDETITTANEAEPTPPAEPVVPTVVETVPETTIETSEPMATEDKTDKSESPADAVADSQPAEVEPQLEPRTSTEEVSSDESQKRKRKSVTPSPSEQEIAAKRARALSEQERQEDANAAAAAAAAAAPVNETLPADAPAPMDVEQTPPAPPAATVSLSNEEASLPLPPASSPPPPLSSAHAPETTANDEMDIDQSVAPAQHPATTALYISNLMRPLRPADVQAHVCELAAAPGQAGDDDVIAQFHLDQIRTHAFVVLATVQAASRVRSQLHDRVWPNESNRKPLSVDFVPPEKINDWIAMEEGGGGRGGGGGRPGRSTARWEVIYTRGSDGAIEARLQQAGSSFSRPGPPPPGPASQAGANDPIPPTGPRSDRERGGGGPRSPRGGGRDSRRDDFGGASSRQQQPIPPPPSDLDYELQRTRARPSIGFQLVSPALARRRVDNMRSFYTKDTRRVLGREINRYSFEEGDGFVDRGKEVFEGIRPPHRERGGRGGRGGGRGKFGGRGGGGGRGRGGGGRPQSDRYLPGLSGGGVGGGGRRWDDDRRY